MHPDTFLVYPEDALQKIKELMGFTFLCDNRWVSGRYHTKLCKVPYIRASPYALFGTPKFEINHLPNFILRKPRKKKNKTKQKKLN